MPAFPSLAFSKPSSAMSSRDSLSLKHTTSSAPSSPPKWHDATNQAELDFLKSLSNSAALENPDTGYLQNAPLFTRDAFDQKGLFQDSWKYKSVLGEVKEQHVAGLPLRTESPQLYLNVAAPFSAVICGVQGSGKSHSLSVALESCFISHPAVGPAPAPLAGIAFHYGSATFGQPCEQAHLSSLTRFAEIAEESKAPSVTVLVSPSSINTMKKAYAGLPHVSVQPLQLAHSDLNASRMLALMGNDDESKVPLYMTAIMAMVRKQGSDNFNYAILRSQIERSKDSFNDSQNQMLALRLELIDSFCPPKGATKSIKTYFKAGTLVIVDLSDPFLGEAAACTMFDILLGLFLEADTGCKGKIIALDEAHTFLTSTSSTRLIASLVNIIRLQRHLGVRTLISTQEPTCVPSAILHLVSFILVHRFSSPAWANHLDSHVATKADTKLEWFDTITNLRTGEACLFSPSTVGATEEGKLQRLGRGFFKVAVRPRLTSDGGRSILAV